MSIIRKTKAEQPEHGQKEKISKEQPEHGQKEKISKEQPEHGQKEKISKEQPERGQKEKISKEQPERGQKKKIYKEQQRKESKQQIRKRYLKRRNDIPEEKRARASEKIRERLLKLPYVQNAPTVFLYASQKSEVSTKSLIQTLLKEGRKVALPKVTGDEMEFYEIDSWEDLFPGYQGILEPQVRNEQPVRPNSRDVILLPGVCFDYAGNRLGYGRGYYDRYLAGLTGKPMLIGIAYEKQIYRYTLPAEPQDKRVACIVTEKKKVKTKAEKEKGFGFLDFVIDFVLELVLELID